VEVLINVAQSNFNGHQMKLVATLKAAGIVLVMSLAYIKVALEVKDYKYADTQACLELIDQVRGVYANKSLRTLQGQGEYLKISFPGERTIRYLTGYAVLSDTEVLNIMEDGVVDGYELSELLDTAGTECQRNNERLTPGSL